MEHARGNALEARSFRKPRLNAYTSYDRTLKSEFEGFGGFASDSTAPADSESAEVPFGSAHTYRAGLAASYMVFSGGRGLAQSRAAASTRRAAEIGFTSARAQLRLDVAEAYYNAMLSDRLLRIAEWTFEQADSTYNRAALVSAAGRAPEFDVVRAKASRDRQRPIVIQRQAEHDVALLRLRHLLHLTPTADLVLPTDILASAPTADGLQEQLDVTLRGRGIDRSAVREAAESVVRGEQMVAASEAGHLPTVTLTSTYERVAYPLDGNPSWSKARANWTVGGRIDLPVLSGGHQNGSDAMAHAELDAARARLRLTQQLAELDTRSSIARLAAAEAALSATDATVAEAQKAYDIASLRYREGVSIQLELSDARLGLEQARADQARAARDASVERIRASLLINLPLGLGGAAVVQRVDAARSVAP
jgi:outer membrane protein TolC